MENMLKIRGLVVAVALLIVLVGCAAKSSTVSPAATGADGLPVAHAAGCSQVGSVRFAKTKFLVHAGLGAGAFYQFLYKPFKAGKFRKGAQGRIKSMAFAGGAALFAVHELKVAKKDAEADKTLCKLVAPIDQMTARLTGVGSQLKAGTFDPSSITGAAGGMSALSSAAGGLGANIKNLVPKSLGSFAG
jgi:hypothetical protein